ncbi:hypothetical protein LSCM1_03305 [Leishmania martiniquensis]|uniref:Uncharacterized protein n=1 Tax=Leishmania martiniquensis TaxID=1580590 RepID=A0A836KQJ2_9TRYP|nr:hypothetical protein LSCM1_03305 [Leishmania martiniquensis]
MAAEVVPIGIPPQERARLCALAAADVCQRSVAHVDAAARCAARYATAAPYIRALYVLRAGSVVAERVAVALGCECGPYLRETLRATVADIEAPAVACWLTVTLEDTCILQHAVFAISSESKVPLKMAPPFHEKQDRTACPAGARRWSSLRAHAQRCAADGDSVYTSGDETLAAEVPPPPGAAEASPPPPPQHAPSAAMQPLQPRTPLLTQNTYEKMQKNQVDAGCNPASSARRSSHAAQPPEEDAARPHLSLFNAGAAPRLGGPGSGASAPSPPSFAAALARPDSGQRSYHTQPEPASHQSRSQSAEHSLRQSGAVSSITISQNCGHLRAPRPSADELMNGRLCTDLVVPNDGRQWSDWAFRTCYSPRREELWEIADAVMTHNYHCHMIEGGGESPSNTSRRLRDNEY